MKRISDMLQTRMGVLVAMGGLALTWGMAAAATTWTEDDHAGHDHAAHANDVDHGDDEHADTRDQRADACCPDHGSAHDDHGHDERGDERDARPDATSAGHDHDHAAPGHAHGHEQARRVPVTREQVSRFGIKTAVAARGRVAPGVRVPGEIRVNEDRVAHVVPRASGVARTVHKALGDRVKAGEILAWIESGELAEAKLDFYAKAAEVACCEIEMPRARAIHENVAKLVGMLKQEQEPAENDIRALDDLEMGAYRGQLLTAHAHYRAARTVYERERQLREKAISSAQDLLSARTELDRARSRFRAALDTARYETLIAYTEAVNERQVAAFHAVAAEKKLRLKGADDALVAALRALVPQGVGAPPCPCDDPNCKQDHIPSVGEVLGGDDRFAWYALRSPFDGTVIEKHIVRGESLDDASEVFTIADLSTVWVDLTLSQAALASVREGQPMTLRLPDGVSADSRIDFVSPTIDRETRTALARATLDNSGGGFRPGTFIEAVIRLPSDGAGVVVPKASVQLVNDRPCVFVWRDGAFELREITTGRADDDRIEVVRGLAAGEKVAAVNAFHLKTEYVKSAAGDLGAHHGHAH
jgi:multidrug efflux pump subunit AcrA (membrane-fusion protein)